MQAYYNYNRHFTTPLERKRKENHRKIFRFMLIVILVLISFIFGSFINVFANTNETNSSDMSMSNVEYRTVDVEQGDTLWTIAQSQVGSEMDIRKYVNEIKKLNDIKGSLINEGQIIKLP